MKQIKKMSTVSALMRFRNEIADVKLSSSQRIALLNEFKMWWEKSEDYDLAFDRIAPKIAPEFKSQKSFKSFWKEFNKGIDIKKGFFSTEESKLRSAICNGFKEGLTEVSVINALILNASEFFKRPPTQIEIDKIRYFVISEKIKLQNKGVKVNG